MTRIVVGGACAAFSVALLLWAIVGPDRANSGLPLVGLALALLLAAMLLLRTNPARI